MFLKQKSPPSLIEIDTNKQDYNPIFDSDRESLLLIFASNNIPLKVNI